MSKATAGKAPAAKRTYKKKPVKKARDSAMSPASFPSPELKNVDTVGSLALSNTGVGSGHTALINGLIPGTERYNRLGRRVTAKSIMVRCYLYTSAASPAVVDDLFRIAVIWDEQPIGTLPTSAQLWNGVDSSGAVTTNMLSFNNRDNSMRFKTLRTHTVQINAENQASETYQGRIYWEWNIPCNFTTQYNAGVTGGLGDIVTGALYLVAHGNNSSTAQWSIDYTTRFKFND
jgi:hypothetical protein